MHVIQAYSDRYLTCAAVHCHLFTHVPWQRDCYLLYYSHWLNLWERFRLNQWYKVAGRQSSVSLYILFTWPYICFMLKNNNNPWISSLLWESVLVVHLRDLFVVNESFGTDASLMARYSISCPYQLSVGQRMHFLIQVNWSTPPGTIKATICPPPLINLLSSFICCFLFPVKKNWDIFIKQSILTGLLVTHRKIKSETWRDVIHVGGFLNIIPYCRSCVKHNFRHKFREFHHLMFLIKM